MTESLKKQTIRNVGYNTTAKIIMFGFQGLANIILSQNLGAGDYGIVGFAMIFVSFLARFNDLGIQSAVIQRKEIDDKILHTAFTIKLCLGFVMYAVTFAIAGVALYFFDNPAVAPVIRLIALTFIINSFAFIPMVQLNRELNFKKISILEVVKGVVNSIVAVCMALSGFKYWSIVIATLASNLTGILVVNTIRPVKIKLNFDKEIARHLIRFGGNLFLSGLLTFLVFNADNFIVGSVAGSSALGYYALAFNWGALICTVLSDLVHSVLFPTFAKMQGDTDRIKNAYLQVIEIVGFVAIMVNIILFIGAEPFLYYVLGKGTDKWFPALNVFRIMCVYGVLRAMLEPIGSVIMAIGRTDLLLKANFVAATVELILLYPAIKLFGLVGVGVLVGIAYTAQYFVYWPAIKKSINIKLKEVLGVMTPLILPFMLVVAGSMISISYTYGNIGILIVPIGVFVFVGLFGVLSKWKLLNHVKLVLNGMK